MMRENGSSMGVGSSDRIVAADRIAIYSQDSAWEGILYSSSTLKEYGCGLFTVNHAMQWVGIDPVPSPAAMAETDRKRGFYFLQTGSSVIPTSRVPVMRLSFASRILKRSPFTRSVTATLVIERAGIRSYGAASSRTGRQAPGTVDRRRRDG